MPDLINDVKIDAKHSFEDVIVPVEEFKIRWGKDVAVLGGVGRGPLESAITRPHTRTHAADSGSLRPWRRLRVRVRQLDHQLRSDRQLPRHARNYPPFQRTNVIHCLLNDFVSYEQRQTMQIR